MTEKEALRRAFDANPKGTARLQELLKGGKLASTATLADGEPITIVAIDKHNGITGSRRAVCETCSAKVWLAPSSQDIQRTHAGEVHILCLECMLKQQEAEQAGKMQ